MARTSRKEPLKAWRWIMAMAGWKTVTEMAKDTGISDDTLRGYVYNGAMPPVDKAARIARAAHVDLTGFAKELELQTIK